MPIQIIDGFSVNTSTPIDSRIVASGSVARSNIPYKYEGLRVYDTSNRTPYVWINNSWLLDNNVNGVTNSIPYYSAYNSFGSSIMYQSGTNIGIGISTPSTKLDVSGTIKGTSFVGDGSTITNLNASNISSGTMTLNRLTNGVNKQVLLAGTSQPVYTNQNQLVVGTASRALKLNVTNMTGGGYLTTAVNDGDQFIKVAKNITFDSDNGILNLVYATGYLDDGIGTTIQQNAMNYNAASKTIQSSFLYQKTYQDLFNDFDEIYCTFSVDVSSVVYIDATYTTFTMDSNELGVRQGNKVVSAYAVDENGNVSLIHENTTSFGANVDIGTMSVYKGYINMGTNGDFGFGQTGSSLYQFTLFGNVSYNISVMTAGTFGIQYM